MHVLGPWAIAWEVRGCPPLSAKRTTAATDGGSHTRKKCVFDFGGESGAARLVFPRHGTFRPDWGLSIVQGRTQ
jgi:hypothetical protein